MQKGLQIPRSRASVARAPALAAAMSCSSLVEANVASDKMFDRTIGVLEVADNEAKAKAPPTSWPIPFKTAAFRCWRHWATAARLEAGGALPVHQRLGVNWRLIRAEGGPQRRV